MFIFSIHGLKFRHPQICQSPGFLALVCHLKQLDTFWEQQDRTPPQFVSAIEMCWGKKPRPADSHPAADPACRDWLAPLSLALTAVPPTPGVLEGREAAFSP